ncbi:MAG: sigma-70 family RNA polymerase sigma factor [Verrucomicrobia bacterium]|nr:sigma-70 family RNA polymerase sigma factor [Verrucomicrobiota bacterium]
MSDTDIELLARYTRHHAEDAFAEIVRRHLDLVHSAALRQIRSPQLAEEVAQSTFINLARHAHQLAPDTILAAWLYQVARRESIDVVRREARRQLREQIATEMNALNATTADWTHIEPLLDEAMHALDDTDRAAVLLRYFENKSLSEVGRTLGTSDDAAQKRVSRAVERLREFFARRGVTVGVSGLVVAISANAVQAAPVGLAVTISTSAVLSGMAIKTTTIGLTKTLAMTAIQKTLISATIAVAVGTGIYEARRAAQFQSQAQALQQQQNSLVEQTRQLRQERDDVAGKLAAAQLGAGNVTGNTTELLKLRAQVTRLQGNARELAQLKAATAATGNDPAIEATLKSWAARATQLKERLGQMPDKRIPELQLLTDKDWFDAIKNVKQLETDTDVRQALNNLRNSAKQAFGDITRDALKKYAEANNGMLPEDWSQLKPYFETPVGGAMFQRYSLLQTGKLADVPQNEYLFAEKAPPVDDEYDSLYEFGMNGTKSSSVSDPGDIVWNGLLQFAKTHNGNLPTDAAQLAPYLKRPLEQAKVQEFLVQIPSGVTTMEQLKAAGPK